MPKEQKRIDGIPSSATLSRKAAAHLTARGKFAKAEEYLLKAARCLVRGRLASRAERFGVWNELGMVCKYLGKYRSAERYYMQALRGAARLEGEARDQLVANLYHNLGGLEHSMGRFARAEVYARKGLALRLQISAGSDTAAASDMAALAAILDGLGEYAESKKLYDKALRIYQRYFGAAHPEIAVVLNNLGAQFQSRGRADRAEYYYRCALRMKRRVLDRSHPDIALTMNNLATVLYAEGKLRNACQWFQKALRLSNESLGRSHPVTRKMQQNFDRAMATSAVRRLPILPKE